MDSIYFGEEHAAFRDQLRRFVAEEVRPNADAWAGEIPRDAFRRMGALGFLGVRYPEEFGGAGMDTFGSVVLGEELGRAGLSGFAVSTLVHTDMASPHLARYGTREQKARYMPGVVAGETVTAIGVTEPGAGSDVASVRTRAERHGNGWLLNGAKMFITNGVLPISTSSPRAPIRTRSPRAGSRSSSSRRARRVSLWPASSTRWAGAARTRPSSPSRTSN